MEVRAAPREPVTPEVLPHPQAGAPVPTSSPFSFLPTFPGLMGKVDAIARRVPWYLWVGGTLAVLWWFGRKKGKGGVKALLGG